MKTFSISLSLLLASLPLFSQVEKTSVLYRTLKTQDSLLFNVGFNTCDIKPFEDLISKDFEFYHDNSGRIFSKKAFIKQVRDGLCKLSYQPRRQLVENTL